MNGLHEMTGGALIVSMMDIDASESTLEQREDRAALLGEWRDRHGDEAAEILQIDLTALLRVRWAI